MLTGASGDGCALNAEQPPQPYRATAERAFCLHGKYYQTSFILPQYYRLLAATGNFAIRLGHGRP